MFKKIVFFFGAFIGIVWLILFASSKLILYLQAQPVVKAAQEDSMYFKVVDAASNGPIPNARISVMARYESFVANKAQVGPSKRCYLLETDSTGTASIPMDFFFVKKISRNQVFPLLPLPIYSKVKDSHLPSEATICSWRRDYSYDCTTVGGKDSFLTGEDFTPTPILSLKLGVDTLELYMNENESSGHANNDIFGYFQRKSRVKRLFDEDGCRVWDANQEPDYSDWQKERKKNKSTVSTIAQQFKSHEKNFKHAMPIEYAKRARTSHEWIEVGDYARALAILQDMMEENAKANRVDYWPYGWAALCVAKLGGFEMVLHYYEIYKDKTLGPNNVKSNHGIRYYSVRDLEKLIQESKHPDKDVILLKMQEIDCPWC